MLPIVSRWLSFSHVNAKQFNLVSRVNESNKKRKEKYKRDWAGLSDLNNVEKCSYEAMSAEQDKNLMFYEILWLFQPAKSWVGVGGGVICVMDEKKALELCDKIQLFINWHFESTWKRLQSSGLFARVDFSVRSKDWRGGVEDSVVACEGRGASALVWLIVVVVEPAVDAASCRKFKFLSSQCGFFRVFYLLIPKMHACRAISPWDEGWLR